MQRIGVLTSGGDSSGMNAAIRAVVKQAVYLGLEIAGIRRGFTGFMEGDISLIGPEAVGDIIHRGGTVLQTARSEEFKTTKGRAKAWENAGRFGLHGLVVIGGDGSFRGAAAFHREHGLPVVGVPGTIDNDIWGTDYSVGFDTAVNLAVDAINRIRDTAASYERIFIVEVMGRDSGFIALAAGFASGAESILIPEQPFRIEEICDQLRRSHRLGKLPHILVVAEGVAGESEIGRQIKERTGFDTRVTVLGHLQRGGTPTAFDRILASRLGARAAEMLMSGTGCRMVGVVAGELVESDMEEVIARKKTVDFEMYRLAAVLSI